MKNSVSRSCLAGRTILMGITGGIAAYKVAGWVSSLVQEKARVKVIMTGSATRFVGPVTFAALSGHRVHTDLFDPEDDPMSHISLAEDIDLFLIAPLTAHTLARLAHGLADDLLTATALATTAPVVLCPAMNSKMLSHGATHRNLRLVRELGYRIVEPAEGALACGRRGPGRLAPYAEVREAILTALAGDDLRGQRIVITAGPTREPLDPARYLSNRSSGKMGYALAATAGRRGARVTLISGPTTLAPPPGVSLVSVETAEEMYDAVMAARSGATIIVKAAAVADFRPAEYRDEKMKKAAAAMELALSPTRDILAELGEWAQRLSDDAVFLVGFAAESCCHLEEGARKLREKHADLICVNDIAGRDTGFDVDTNKVFLLDENGTTELELMSKEETADAIWDHVIAMMQRR